MGTIVLDDGTTHTTYPIAAGNHTLGLALGNVGGQAEKVVNGGFDAGLTGWQTLIGSPSVAAGELLLTQGTGAGAVGSGVQQQTSGLSAVGVYEFTFNYTNSAFASVPNYMGISLTDDGSFITTPVSHTAVGSGSYTTTVTGATDYFIIIKSANADVTIDNVSVKEVVNTMQLTIDGVLQSERSYTPIAQGLITTNATHWDLRSDLENSYADAQAKLLTWDDGSSGAIGIKYDPLELSPQWTVINNAPSNMILEADGGYVFDNDSSESLVAFSMVAGDAPIQYTDMEISALMIDELASNNRSSFQLAVRATDHNNFVGMRNYNGEYQLYERVGGVFAFIGGVVSNVGTTPVVVTVKVVGNQASLLVGGVVMTTATTTLLTAGYGGLISRTGINNQPATCRAYKLVGLD